MRPLTLVGTSLLFAACDFTPVAEGEMCEEEGATSCATDPEDDAGYSCDAGHWTADPDCECDHELEVTVCVDIQVGFTGVGRAGARLAAGHRVRRA